MQLLAEVEREFLGEEDAAPVEDVLLGRVAPRELLADLQPEFVGLLAVDPGRAADLARGRGLVGRGAQALGADELGAEDKEAGG